MTFWNSTLVKCGKRDHRCESCRRVVPSGQSSYAESGLFEGEFHSYRLCLPCRAFIVRQFEHGNLDRGESFELGWLPDIARDVGEPWPPAPMSAEVRCHCGCVVSSGEIPCDTPSCALASAGEAATAATTKIGAVHEHAAREAGDAQNIAQDIGGPSQ